MRPFHLGFGLMAGKVGSADAAKPVTSETMAAKTVGFTNLFFRQGTFMRMYPVD